ADERHLAPAADARPLARRPTALQVAHRGVARHVQDIALLPLAQCRAELGGPAELVVAGDPAVGQPGQAPVEQLQGDLPLLTECDLRRDVALLAAGLVAGPALRQVEPAVERGVAAPGGVGEEDADLAVVDLAEPAAPLPRDPARLGPL